MSDLCQLHSGYASRALENRKPLDKIVAKLPSSQAGDGEHRCAYCAYVQGYEDAKQAMQAALEKLSPPRPARETLPKAGDSLDFPDFQVE